jgi:hypothetical protein
MPNALSLRSRARRDSRRAVSLTTLVFLATQVSRVTSFPRCTSLRAVYFASLLALLSLATGGAARAQTLEVPASFFASVEANGSGGLYFVPRSNAAQPAAARKVKTLNESYAFVSALAWDQNTGELWIAEFRPHPIYTPRFQALLFRARVQIYPSEAPRIVAEQQVVDLWTVPTLQGLAIEGIEASSTRVHFLLGGSLLSIARDGTGLRPEAQIAPYAQQLDRLGDELFAIDNHGAVIAWNLLSSTKRTVYQGSLPIADVRAIADTMLLATDTGGTSHRLFPSGQLLQKTPYPTAKVLRAAADPQSGQPLLAFQEDAQLQRELRVFSGSFVGPEVPGSYPRKLTAILALPREHQLLGTGCSGALTGETAIQPCGRPTAGNVSFGVLAAAPQPPAGAIALIGLATQPPIELSGLGAPQCFLHVQPLFLAPMAPVSGNSVELALPLPPGCSGLPLSVQAVMLVSGANSGQLLTSAALTTQVR